MTINLIISTKLQLHNEKNVRNTLELFLDLYKQVVLHNENNVHN